jgi:4-oxalomesaconate tautomerase
VPEGSVKQMSVEHPSGELSVTLEVGGTKDRPTVENGLIMRGEVLVPAAVWDGRR